MASAWSRKHAGTGLGLPLAIGLVELHGGKLTIESRKGEGTRVVVIFPPDRTVRERAAAAAPVAHETSFAAAKPRSV